MPKILFFSCNTLVVIVGLMEREAYYKIQGRGGGGFKNALKVFKNQTEFPTIKFIKGF